MRGVIYHSRQTPARNIILTLPGVRCRVRMLRNKSSKKEVWKLLFDHTITDTIENTNRKLETI